MKKDSLMKIIILVVVIAVIATLVCVFVLPKINTPTNPETSPIASQPIDTEQQPTESKPIELEVPAHSVSFYATVLEIAGNRFVVEPIEDSNERKIADKITFVYNSPSYDWMPGVGTFVYITYDASVLESYPAQLGTVYKVEPTAPPDNPPQENATIPPNHENMPTGPAVPNPNE